MYENLKKNTVDSKNQLTSSEYVHMRNVGGKGTRVLFVGNSITLHGVKEEIGWFQEWGMAASAEDKDYVHLLMKKITEKDAEATFCICQVAHWERSYKNPAGIHETFRGARDFGADVIIFRLVENCPSTEFDSAAFKKAYFELIDFLNASGTAKAVITSSFWKHPADETIAEVAKEKGYPHVEISDLGELDEMKAVGLFWHAGVANHPGDLGMEKIAERIWDEAEKLF